MRHYGYQGFSFKDIAKELGIKHPSIHHHFPTKLHLCEEVINQYHLDFFKCLKESKEGATIKETITLLCDLFHDSYKQGYCMCLCGILAVDSGLPDILKSRIRFFFKELIGYLEVCIEKSKQDGIIRLDLSSHRSAQCIVSMLEGNLMLSLLNEQDTYLVNQNEPIFYLLGLAPPS